MVDYWGNTSGFSKKLHKSHRKRNNNWHGIHFIQSASEIGIKRASSGTKLDGMKLDSPHFKAKSIILKVAFLR